MFDSTPVLSPQVASALVCLTIMVGLGVAIWLHCRQASEARLRRQNSLLRERLARYESA